VLQNVLRTEVQETITKEAHNIKSKPKWNKVKTANRPAQNHPLESDMIKNEIMLDPISNDNGSFPIIIKQDDVTPFVEEEANESPPIIKPASARKYVNVRRNRARRSVSNDTNKSNINLTED
jgi:hypothetical protein